MHSNADESLDLSCGNLVWLVTRLYIEDRGTVLQKVREGLIEDTFEDLGLHKSTK